jgi:hypothetical protein
MWHTEVELPCCASQTHGLAQHVGVLIGQHLVHRFLDAHPAHVGHRGALPVGTEAPTILSPGWPAYRPPSPVSDTTRRDATAVAATLNDLLAGARLLPRLGADATGGWRAVDRPTRSADRTAHPVHERCCPATPAPADPPVAGGYGSRWDRCTLASS